MEEELVLDQIVKLTVDKKIKWIILYEDFIEEYLANYNISLNKLIHIRYIRNLRYKDKSYIEIFFIKKNIRDRKYSISYSKYKNLFENLNRLITKNMSIGR